MSVKRQILVTSALPYANGPIHLGHMVEHVQADIWVRFQRSRGHDCLFICGDDAHGTPIMISAERQGISPETLIDNIRIGHERDFAAFNISYDNYYTTHSPENKAFADEIYKALRDRGDINVREISQLYDPVKNMFLPDRYVKGECPSCGKADQYGDNCENCGATYLPTDLKNPVSVLSNSTPIEKQSVHYFFNLANYQTLLENWLRAGHLQSAVSNKLLEWFKEGLNEWDISRDAPYFGFEIPDAPGKYFYVWLDAPIGYLASFKNLCTKRPEINFDHYWRNDNVELYHFVGKDIVYFHALFWPAMLHGSGFRMPTCVFAHGFLTVNGLKMSKSRGTFINASDYLENLNPEYLRYYFAAKLGDGVDDIDFNFADFIQRVNSDLVGKVINIASRCAGFITKKLDGKLADTLEDAPIFQETIAPSEKIAALFENRCYSHAVREIMALADKVNQYIADQAPWTLAKQDENLQRVQIICTVGLNCFKVLMTYLQPITPSLADKAQAFLNCAPLSWQTVTAPLLNQTINEFVPMLTRIEQAAVDNLVGEPIE